ncbi:hypothetical protein CL652_01330 [bacterium]|mgnify:CR=1 FL=1|nr:hypothetical protein [bacterium]
MPEHFYFLFFGFFLNNTSEAGLTRYIIENMHEGNTVIDIGANCGFYTLLTSKLVGENGRVHAFEPTEQIFRLLQKSTRNLSNTTVNQKALLDYSGTSHFYADDSYSVANSIERSLDTQAKFEVETQTLDEYCVENNVVPDFIKIDAEGSELKILQGSTRILGQCEPIIAMELLRDAEDQGQEAVELFLKMRYSAFRIENDGTLSLVSIETLRDESIFDGEGFVNLIFKKELV